MGLNSRTVKLAAANIRNKFSEGLYLKCGIDITRPVQVSGLVNTVCNARCLMCDSWQKKQGAEAPASIWIKGLRSLKEFSGAFHINFSGGEPLLKRGLFEILEYCRKEDIIAGITTNGLLLNEESIRRILECKLYNINISVDSMNEGVHDALRGVPGMLSRIKGNIEYLAKAKKEQKSSCLIVLKPIICAKNIQGLEKIVEYAKDLGLNGVNFQPMSLRTGECKDMINVDSDLLKAFIDRLILMKKDRYPVLNSDTEIRQWSEYFKKMQSGGRVSCRVPLRNMFILPNGDALLCIRRDDSLIGNIADRDIKEMWRSENAKRLRSSLARCNRFCADTCLVKKGWKGYLDMFFRFIR